MYSGFQISGKGSGEWDNWVGEFEILPGEYLHFFPFGSAKFAVRRVNSEPLLTGIKILWSEEMKFSYNLEYGESCLNIGSESPVITWEVIFSYGYQQKVRILSEYTYGN